MSENKWESEVYAVGRQINRWPFTQLVSDVTRMAARSTISGTSVLELGCGTGNNVWFLLDSGFEVCGIDIAPTAVAIARENSRRLGYKPDLRVGDIAELPWHAESFDLVIDRGTLSQVTLAEMATTLSEVHRVLKPGGMFLSYNLFGWNCSGRIHGVEVSPRSYADFTGGRFFSNSPMTTFLDAPLIAEMWLPLRIVKLLRHEVSEVGSEEVEEYYTVHATKEA
jgi:SAM-dependent methyltransferase